MLRQQSLHNTMNAEVLNVRPFGSSFLHLGFTIAAVRRKSMRSRSVVSICRRPTNAVRQRGTIFSLCLLKTVLLPCTIMRLPASVVSRLDGTVTPPEAAKLTAMSDHVPELGVLETLPETWVAGGNCVDVSVVRGENSIVEAGEIAVDFSLPMAAATASSNHFCSPENSFSWAFISSIVTESTRASALEKEVGVIRLRSGDEGRQVGILETDAKKKQTCN